ncbi:MAG TPA: sulfatase [Kofleriaceae bacterium]|nr:sulfatase [Kofleriaceae bacterium]
MAVLQARSRLVPALRWLAPSAVAACAGALVAGLVEGRGGGGALGVLATTGFVALIAVPTLLAGGAAVRGVVAAWRPGELAAALVDADGAAPRLAGWLAVIWLGALGLAGVMFQSVWLLAMVTAFKPLATSFLEPVFAVTTALAIVAVSRPAARLFAHLARRIDARWRRGGRRTLLRPPIAFGAAIGTALAALAALWRFAVLPHIGPLDTAPLVVPAAGLVTAVALHAAWPRLGRARRTIGAGCAAAAGLAIATALIAAFTWPSRTLEIWGDRPVAGLAIDALFDLDAIRARMSLGMFRPVERPGAAHPDIVLITIDTVRADHTPPYGGHAAMPALQALAARGAVFDRALSPSNVTRRSVPSIVTGLSADRVRGRVVGWALRIDPRHVVLAERMRAGGYDTAGFMCCEGFWGKSFHTGLERGLGHLEIEPHGPTLAHRARFWLDQRERRPGAPLFLWMHILEPHNWTIGAGGPEVRGDADRRGAYDRALAASDQMVAEVLDAFARRSPERMPIVIITADHGESLGEHGHPYHSTDLYDAQIRVPLVIGGPGLAARRIPETVSLTDLVPTVLELGGFVAPTGTSLDGSSFADLATGRRTGELDAGVAFAAMIKDRSNPGGVTAVSKGRWKLIIDNDNLELYDIRTDPGEHDNVIGQHAQIAGELRKLLANRAARAAAPPFE